MKHCFLNKKQKKSLTNGRVFVRIRIGDIVWRTIKNNFEIVLFLTPVLIVCWLRTAQPDNDEVEKETESRKIAIPIIVL